MLGLIAEGPTHGFSIARLLEADGHLGRVFRVPRPAVYRAVENLVKAGLVEPAGTAVGRRGPQRTMLKVTARGRTLTRAWLGRPVLHVRDIRTELLVKLALLHRRGVDPSRLLAAQSRILEPIVESLAEQHRSSSGFDRTLAAWRLESAKAALRFLEGLSRRAG